jgi:dihydrofolate reductase
MRELIVTQNITIDGVIDASDGWFKPSGAEEVDQTDIISAQREQRNGADAVLMGRVTFEQMRGYWPLQTDDESGVADYLNEVSKYVVSSKLQDPQWDNTTVLGGALVDQVEAMKSEPGKDIVATGSLTLMPDLIASGLVDEYRLFVYPVVLGRGQRLFADATEVPKLHLAEAQPFRSGIALMRYRPRPEPRSSFASAP